MRRTWRSPRTDASSSRRGPHAIRGRYDERGESAVRSNGGAFMKALVLGGGVIGVTTAYYLAREGCEVTVVERNDGVGREASGSNAGILAAGAVDAPPIAVRTANRDSGAAAGRSETVHLGPAVSPRVHGGARPPQYA